jgi:pyruvate dehydrogenase E2 component (dihydrolipoamide acetyltransferase)
MEEGTIARWVKKEGEEVKKGEILLEITTDKATLEVESYASGILKKIIAKEGEVVPVTEVIAFIGEPKDEVPQEKIKTAREKIEKKGQPAPEQKPAASPAPASAQKPVASPAPASAQPEGRVPISPRARRLAEEKGVDISRVKGSGPGGRIVEEDIMNFGKTPQAAQPAAPGELTPLTPMRRIIAERMILSKTTIPHYYETIEVDMSECVVIKKALGNEGKKVSYNDFLIRAAALGIKEFPMMNNSWTPQGIKVNKGINIGIVVSLEEEGMLIPVIKNTDAKGLVELAGIVKDLAEKARAHHLKPDEFSGGTFTISNLGMFDIENFIAVIYPGESAILASGRMADKPVAKAGQVVIRPILTLTLSSDHRIIDGVLAARFLQKVKELLEKPEKLK